MRLLLQGEDEMAPVLPDQFFTFRANGTFNIISLIAAGYNKLDAYIVGAGGGGGGGGGCESITGVQGGGGAGGGAGGAYKQLIGLDLSTLDASLSVVVGVGGAGGIGALHSSSPGGGIGGNSVFNGVTAYGGGGGAGGSRGSSAPIEGGNGAYGGSYDAAGDVTTTSSVVQHGSGKGGYGGGYSTNTSLNGKPGNNASPYAVFPDGNYGGGGGGGGGQAGFGSAQRGIQGAGGIGKLGQPSVGIKGYIWGDTMHAFGGGYGGGGGGGADLTAITGQPGLTLVGQGGRGGAGFAVRSGVFHNVNTVGLKGQAGAVLIRVYFTP